MPQTRRETLLTWTGFIAMVSISLLVAYPRLTEGLPIGVDSESHLFKVFYLYKTYTTYGYLPSWCSDWYGGTPFLVFYPPLAYLMTFAVALLNADPLLAYKLVETFFYAVAPLAVYLLARELELDKIQSMFAGLIFTITPVAIENFTFYDRFATVISVPFLCLFLIVFMRSLKSRRLAPLVLSSFLLTVLILIHHLSAYYLGIIALFMAITQYMRTRDAKGIALRMALIVAASLLLSSFWLYPFVSATFATNNIFYNRSITDNLISPTAFSVTVFLLGIVQFLAANIEIAEHISASMGKAKNSPGTFRLFLPSLSVMAGSAVSYLYVPAGQVLIILGFVAFFISFFQSVRRSKVREVNLIFCSLWFLAFLWLGLGVYAGLIVALPFFDKLDTLRFTFYLAIPQSILAGKLFAEILSKARGFTATGIRAGEKRFLAALLCLALVLTVNLYVANDYIMQPNNFITAEAAIPREVTSFFSSSPYMARILSIRCPDWIYVLPYYTGKPIIDGWYPQEKLLPPLLEINDYQINTLNILNTTSERVDKWSNLLGNASRLGINWVIIGEPALNSIMANYTRFTAVQRTGNLTIYESQPTVSLVDVDDESAVGNLSINYSSPGRITLKISDVTRPVKVTVKEADFNGWEISANGAPIQHSRDDFGFMTFQLGPGNSYTVNLAYVKQNFSLVSLMTLLFMVVVLLAEFTGRLKLPAKRT